jgi:hypothetical protein
MANNNKQSQYDFRLSSMTISRKYASKFVFQLQDLNTTKRFKEFHFLTWESVPVKPATPPQQNLSSVLTFGDYWIPQIPRQNRDVSLINFPFSNKGGTVRHIMLTFDGYRAFKFTVTFQWAIPRFASLHGIWRRIY